MNQSTAACLMLCLSWFAIERAWCESLARNLFRQVLVKTTQNPSASFDGGAWKLKNESIGLLQCFVCFSNCEPPLKPVACLPSNATHQYRCMAAKTSQHGEVKSCINVKDPELLQDCMDLNKKDGDYCGICDTNFCNLNRSGLQTDFNFKEITANNSSHSPLFPHRNRSNFTRLTYRFREHFLSGSGSASFSVLMMLLVTFVLL